MANKPLYESSKQWENMGKGYLWTVKRCKTGHVSQWPHRHHVPRIPRGPNSWASQPARLSTVLRPLTRNGSLLQHHYDHSAEANYVHYEYIYIYITYIHKIKRLDNAWHVAHCNCLNSTDSLLIGRNSRHLHAAVPATLMCSYESHLDFLSLGSCPSTRVSSLPLRHREFKLLSNYWIKAGQKCQSLQWTSKLTRGSRSICVGASLVGRSYRISWDLENARGLLNLNLPH